MASAPRYKDGRVRILFVDRHEERRCVYLGRVPRTVEKTVRYHVESLASANRSCSAIPDATASWLGEIDDKLHAKLAAVGLVAPREAVEDVTIGGLVKRFQDSAVVGPATVAAYRQGTKSIEAFFGKDRSIAKLTEADADAWRRSLTDEGLAAATIAKRIVIVRALFRRAVRWRLLKVSPFEHLRPGSQVNEERRYYVPLSDLAKILDACPSDEWRAVFALARLGGLRIPTELVGLRWVDIDWSGCSMLVRSPKTKHHGSGHQTRQVPMHPVVVEILQRLFDRAEEGAELVLPRVSSSSANLRTHGHRIIHKAGVKPWPKLFVNCRSSIATDWHAAVPVATASQWLGHSPGVGLRHYSQAQSDQHFRVVTQAPAEWLHQWSHSGAISTSQQESKPAAFAKNGHSDAGMHESMGATGLEPVTSAM
jgi:integrase